MTARFGCALAVLVTLGFSSGADAQTDTQPQVGMQASTEDTMGQDLTGLELGVRASFQLGHGNVVTDFPALNGEIRDLKLSDASNGAVPVQLDLGYRVTPNLFLGVYGSYAYVISKQNPYSCPEGFDCSSFQLRFGPQAQYHFAPGAAFDPWVGLGFGMVFTRTSISGTTAIPVGPGTVVPANLEADVTDRGPEIVNVTVGGNWRLGKMFHLGPFITATFDRHTVRIGEQRVTITGQPERTLALSRVHDGSFALLIFGVKGTWNP